MTQASRDAFLKGIANGKFESQKAQIYLLLCDKPMTLEQLVDYGFKWNIVSTRTSSLMDQGLIEAVGTPRSSFHVIKDPERQDYLIEQRKKQHYDRWYKRGVSMGWIEDLNELTHSLPENLKNLPE